MLNVVRVKLAHILLSVVIITADYAHDKEVFDRPEPREAAQHDVCRWAETKFRRYDISRRS